MTARPPMDWEIRPARRDDLAALVRLCLAHAAYERVELTEDGQAARLERALFEPPARLHCLVVESGGVLVGYASWSREYSTWRAADYLHLDCIYLEPEHRGLGLGRELMRRFAAAVAPQGARHVEWQTPTWNEPAIRFYERLGARGVPKLRFTWDPRNRSVGSSEAAEAGEPPRRARPRDLAAGTPGHPAVAAPRTEGG